MTILQNLPVGVPIKDVKYGKMDEPEADILPQRPSPRDATGKLRRCIDDNVDLDSSYPRKTPMVRENKNSVTK